MTKPPFREAHRSALLQGPRGRRFLLEYGLLSERCKHPGASLGVLAGAVRAASDRLPTTATSQAATIGSRSRLPDTPGEALIEDVAEILTQLPLCAVTEERLLASLAASVDAVRYWQEPDSTDLLLAASLMQEPLSLVADHVATSLLPAWWNRPGSARDQYVIRWEDEPRATAAPPLDVLRKDREVQDAAAALATRDPRSARMSDGTGPSGEWRSTPPDGIVSSTSASENQGPVGLWGTEDNLDQVHADVFQLKVPDTARVYSIDSVESWASLCARFPRDVTATRRHDWRRTTAWMEEGPSRTRRWVLPEWVDVAEHYDAIHLRLGTYLAAAGTAIPIGTDTATVIAGWTPDATYWFTSQTSLTGIPESWEFLEQGTEMRWVRQQTAPRPGGV